MKLFVKQSFGLGDILFLSPIINAYQDTNEIAWSIKDHYFWVKDYLPLKKVTFIKESQLGYFDLNGYKILNFEHAEAVQSHKKYEDCMSAKYGLVSVPLEFWRAIRLNRNLNKEELLIDYLGIKDDEEFILINNHFASPEYNYKIDIKLDTDCRIISLDYIDGFNLLDWCGVLEKAKEIHTVSTSLFFVIEALKLKCPLHLYPRKPLDKDLTPIKTLLHPKWIQHA